MNAGTTNRRSTTPKANQIQGPSRISEIAQPIKNSQKQVPYHLSRWEVANLGLLIRGDPRSLRRHCIDRDSHVAKQSLPEPGRSGHAGLCGWP